MTFKLIDSDKTFISEIIFKLEDVQDIDQYQENKIEFQFPPLIKSDSKDGKWHTLYDAPGFEPEYTYIGAMPRKIQVSATYIIGGPTGGNSKGKGWNIDRVVGQIRIWKKYFYFANFAKNDDGSSSAFAAGGGIGIGKNLPIYRIVWGELLPAKINNSAWRAVSYNVKYSDTWIRDEGKSHPLITEISVNLEMATQVRITQSDPPRQDHSNLNQHAPREWY